MLAMLLAALTAPARPWQAPPSLEGRSNGDVAAIDLGTTAVPEELGAIAPALRPAPVVGIWYPSVWRPTNIIGPPGGRFLGLRDRIVVFATSEDARLGVPLDEQGHRFDDSVLHRARARVGALVALLLALLLIGSAWFPTLRPVRLHAVFSPVRFQASGTLDLPEGTQPRRVGAGVMLDGPAVFRSDDGELVVRLDQRTRILGLGELPTSGAKLTLLAARRPGTLGPRSGTTDLPPSAVLCGFAEPVNTALSHEMHRAPIAPVLCLGALATVICMAIALAL